MAQPAETIATLTKAGKEYPVVDFDQQKAIITCQGMFGSVFATTLQKAQASGYQLSGCTDERLRFSWKTIAEQIAPEPDASGDVTETDGL